ncbi:MAG: stage II sporulation protein R, partial [Oscillospiraceae bacterium]
VRVSFGMRDFPTRAYDDVVVPAGSYQAVCVEIGDAGGRNWWCVMYPPLCLLAPTLPHAGRLEMNAFFTAPMVGDRLYTDIQTGVNYGMCAILVLTGEATRADLVGRI